MFKVGSGLKEDLAKSIMTSHFENLYIYVTTSCNMLCRHCYLGNRLKGQPDMPLDTTLSHLKFWRELGSSKLCFLGGEPTLYAHLQECVEFAHNLNYEKILINSNLSNHACGIIDSLGVDSFTYVQTSLEGVSKNTHEMLRGQDTFDDTVNSIQLLASKGHDVRLIMTVNTLNINEMLPMVKFAENLGCKLVKFHIMSEIGNADKSKKMGISPDTWYHACQAVKEYAIKTKETRNMVISYQPAYSLINNGDADILAQYKGCIGKYKERMSVFPDGKCYICSFLFDREDCYALLENGVIEINSNSIEHTYNIPTCSPCDRCIFDGCIAEESIYNYKVCDEYGLFPVCRLWKLQF